MAEIFDSLFDDPDRFVKYMRDNDSAELRDNILKTDRLKILYCRHVYCRESVFNSIRDINPTTGYVALQVGVVRQWLADYKAGGTWKVIAKGYAMPGGGLPCGIVSLEDEVEYEKGAMRMQRLQVRKDKHGLEAIFSKDSHKHITLYSQADLDDKDGFDRPRNYNGSLQIDNAVPKLRGGCAGILEMVDGTFHVLSEDDGHYWTALIVEKNSLKDLYDGLKNYHENVKVDIDYMKGTSRVSYPNGEEKFPINSERGLFSFEIESRKENAPLLHVSHECKQFTSFDVSWLPEWVVMLEEVVNNED